MPSAVLPADPPVAAAPAAGAPALAETGRPLPVRIDVPEAFRPKARYALAELLRGLGFVPVEAPVAPALVVGPTAPAGVAHVPHAADAPAFFAGHAPYDPGRAAWLETAGEVVPVPFGTPAAPDLVGSAFLWLSGWQELTVPTRDAHGRARHADSLQAAWGLEAVPVVDVYRGLLAAKLRAAGVPVPGRTWGGAPWAFCATCDVDFLRKWRPGILKREALRALRARALGPVRTALDGLRAPSDPYLDALDRLAGLAEGQGGAMTFFLKAGAGDPHDVRYRLGDPGLRAFVARAHAAGHAVGLHPSYRAHDHAGRLAAERDRLARAYGPPAAVRQHYLRYVPGLTGALQAGAGFRIDSTLGWAEREGFRHATTHPFRVWDPAADAPLDLWAFPLAVMDATLFGYRGLDAAGARGTTDRLLAAARRHGGVAVGLWHNDAWDDEDGRGAGAHAEATFESAGRGGARVAPLDAALGAWLAGTP